MTAGIERQARNGLLPHTFKRQPDPGWLAALPEFDEILPRRTADAPAGFIEAGFGAWQK